MEERKRPEDSLIGNLLPNAILKDLILEVFLRGESIQFRALGWSMSPFIKQEDMLVVQPFQGRSPIVGQVVAFIQPETGLLMVHRIIQKRGLNFLIQGDNMVGRDDGIIPIGNILGYVKEVKRKGHKIWYGQGVTGFVIAWFSRLGLIAPIIYRLKNILGKPD